MVRGGLDILINEPIGHVMKRDASQQSSWTHVVAQTIITCVNCLI